MSLKNNNKLKLHRKKPNYIHHTWSSSSTAAASFINKESKQVQLNLMSTQHRIAMYEKKFQTCMESRTELSHWIKSTKEKGLPIPLTEGYKPPPTLSPTPTITTATTRPRLPDLFSSLSTKPKRKQPTEPVPTAKSSLSTFLKKATDSLTSTKRQPLQQQQQQQQTNNRFSLNRFSLPKNSSYTSMTEKYNSNTTPTTKKERNNKKNRFSSPPPLPSNHFNQYQNQRKQQYNISPPSLIQSSNPSVIIPPTTTKTSPQQQQKKLRPQSSILPHSPSSIFLDRLRSRTSCYDVVLEENQLNNSSTTKQVYYPNIISIVDNYNNNNNHLDDVMTPPSSPSSIDSSNFPPLSRQSQDTHSSSCSSTTSSTDQFHNNNSIPNVVKKKRTSLLVSPSLSTIRLLSQKSQFLKRQSMYA